MVIHIIPDETLLDSRDEIEDWMLVLNGIVWECVNRYGFSEGFRNEVIVTMTVAAYLLGLNAIEVLDELVDEKVIDPDEDDEDTWDRVRTVLGYHRRFGWDWAINADGYRTIGLDHGGAHADEMPVRFVID